VPRQWHKATFAFDLKGIVFPTVEDEFEVRIIRALFRREEGSSYRLREYADLLPENLRFKPNAAANPIPPTPEASQPAAKKRRSRSRPWLIANPPDWGIFRRHF
jgi:hypothetical protein